MNEYLKYSEIDKPTKVRARIERLFLNYLEKLSEEELLSLLEYHQEVPTLRIISVPGAGVMLVSQTEALPQALRELQEQYIAVDTVDLQRLAYDDLKRTQQGENKLNEILKRRRKRKKETKT